MHSISDRLREIDPGLFIALLEHADGRAVWAVCETDRAGVESLIFRVGPSCDIDELDQRVIDKINWIRRVPADERAADIERDLAREAEGRVEAEREGLYEQIGGSFYGNLFRCGFIQTPRQESLRPLNKTARRAGRRM